MKIAITGGTGFVGQHFLQALTESDQAIVLTRNTSRANELFSADRFAGRGIECIEWSSNDRPAPVEAFEGADAVVHLLGESVQGRWTSDKKRRIRDSRVVGTQNLVEGLQNVKSCPKTLIGGSAVGFYGSRGDQELSESATAGDDFLADVCQEWETEEAAATDLGMRVVNLRTGVVLGTDGGALAAMKTPFQFCVGGRLGSGKQWFPWIHITDICELIMFAICNGQLSGPLNGSAPQPVTNAEFTQHLASTLNRPAILPVPEFALNIVLGEFASELLSSRRVIPEKATQAGFEFRFPDLQSALSDLLG